jgi:outer membrane protein assembly factor BamD (BamD/ComL family)
METNDQPSSPSVALLRFVALTVLFLSLIAMGLQLVAALSSMDHPDPSASVPPATLFIPPLLSVIAGIALSTLLEGIARLIAAQPTEHEDTSAGQVKLIMTIDELQNTLPTLIGDAVQQAVAQIQIPTEGAASPSTDSELHRQLERMVKLLEEMKDLSMLDESQRQTRRKQVTSRRKDSRLDEVAGLIQQGSWAQADALLHLMESLHPGDAEVIACRQQLDDARILHQANDWEQLTQQVNDLLALSQYSHAIDAAVQFLERYPTHIEAQQLLQRVRQEERIHGENTTGRLYEQIKASVENRQWRTALDGIQVFLDRFPDHPRAEKIRKQIRTIQKNAEIEERHEQEDRIKDLINSQRFREAADLSEDLLQRFPDSPQAAYLTELLPKLRERSTEAEGVVASQNDR